MNLVGRAVLVRPGRLARLGIVVGEPAVEAGGELCDVVGAERLHRGEHQLFPGGERE